MKNLKKYKISLIILIIFLLICLILTKNINKDEIIYSETEDIIKIDEAIVDADESKEEIVLYKVDVKGAVKNPGVYELEVGKRVVDAINKAGGLLKYSNTSTINLSKYIADEMVIIVYTNDEINKMKEDNIKIEYIEKECICPEIKNDACIEESTENDKETSLININTASLDELMTIPKIGESKAQEIIKYRQDNDGFKNTEEIKNISGIKDATYETIKEYITI